ncbi:MAG: VCBS repeat-containing protein [Planctomycetes bacterium]|nr:VCBS repeat-containing protein [Planctomycetota bacterium]
MFLRINTIILSLLAMTAFDGATALAQENDPLFDAAWRSFDTGDFPTFFPEFFDVGDIDGDGDLDVVASRFMFSGPGISVLRSNGDGTFAEEEIYELSWDNAMGEIVLADFDMDGDLDAIGSVVGNAGTGTKIAVWRNNGDGTYAPHIFFTTGEGPIGLVVGDFTGDGFLDVVTANLGLWTGDSVSLLRHNGQTGNQAGFLAPVLTDVGENPQRLAAGDIDGDGDLDLVVGRAAIGGVGANGINILTNDGSGNFSVGAPFVAVPGAFRASSAVVLADLDNDGDLDLITGGADDDNSIDVGQIAIRRNDGAGTFGVPEVLDLVERTWTPHSINVADLNEDGWLDIFVSNPTGRNFDGWSVLMSDSIGGYQAPLFFDGAKKTSDLAAFDVDADGDLDVVTVGKDSSVITVHKNLGGGAFFVPTVWHLDSMITDMDYGDLDNDGDLDLVATSGQIFTLLNNGDGTFPPPVWYSPPMCIGEIRLRDMNNDGFPDLLMASAPMCPPYNFAVSLSNGDGTFAPGVITFVGACQGGQIDAFDLDNDGDLDVVLTEPADCAGGTGRRIFIARNNGNGTSFTLVTPIRPDGLPWRIGGADLDHDGNIDLVTIASVGMTVFAGNGNLSFAAPLVVGEGGVFDFVLADLNLDGNQDLCLLLQEMNGFHQTVFAGTQLGNGDLSFGSRNVYAGPNGAETAFRISNEIEAADVNGDGFADIILSNNASKDVSIFLGNNDGTLQPQDRYGMGWRTSNALAADFTGDGIVDIAAVVGLPPSNLSDGVVVIAGRQGSDGIPGDLDGDGHVGVKDLLILLGAWGPCPPKGDCPADLDGDGSVGVKDLLILLGNWG